MEIKKFLSFLFVVVILFSIIPFVPNGKANPSFTARTETYVNSLSLADPYDITVTKPDGTTNGDILFCWIGFSNILDYTIDSIPAGWIELGDYIPNTDRYALFYKIALDEPASWVWSFDGSTKVRAVCSCYTGGDFDASDPIDVVSNTAYRTSDANCRAASMTVTSPNSPIIFWAGVYSTSARTFTKPTVPEDDWVEDDDAGSTTPDFWTEVCSQIWSGSGATGVMDATISATATTKHAFAVALNPPSGAEERSFELIETMAQTSTLHQLQDHSRIFTEYIIPSAILNQMQGHIYEFLESILPSYTLYQWQEHTYELAETIGITDLLNIWQEQIYLLIETMNHTDMIETLKEISVFLFEFFETINLSDTLEVVIASFESSFLIYFILFLSFAFGCIFILFFGKGIISGKS